MLDDDKKQPLRLTKNDKYVLKQLIEHGRISDSSTAKKLGISPQAVLKIRKKLEDSGIIEGYVPKINFKLLGVKVMAWAVVRFLPETYHEYSEAQINEKVRQHRYVIWGCRIPESDATHILLYGFRDLKQMDEHFIRVQTKLSKIIEIKKMYHFSVEQIVKDSPEGLFYNILSEEELYTQSLFPGSKLIKE